MANVMLGILFYVPYIFQKKMQDKWHLRGINYVTKSITVAAVTHKQVHIKLNFIYAAEDCGWVNQVMLFFNRFINQHWVPAKATHSHTCTI